MNFLIFSVLTFLTFPNMLRGDYATLGADNVRNHQNVTKPPNCLKTTRMSQKPPNCLKTTTSSRNIKTVKMSENQPLSRTKSTVLYLQGKTTISVSKPPTLSQNHRSCLKNHRSCLKNHHSEKPLFATPLGPNLRCFKDVPAQNFRSGVYPNKTSL